MTFTKTLNKNEICRMLNVSSSTLAVYLNKRYISDLQTIGYKKTQKQLTPRQLNYLKDKIGLSPEEEVNS